MINIVYSDDPSVLDVGLYPPQHSGNLQYIQQNLTNFAANLTDTGRMFMEQYSNMYAAINHNEIARKARKLEQAVGGVFDASAIVSLETVEQLQQAGYMMQRYIMANPMVRSLYQANRIQGYADTYIDNEPGRIAEHHIDYRRATSGLVQETSTGFRVRVYMDEPDETDPTLINGVRLAHDQRINIQRTWEAAERALHGNIDITDTYGGEVAP